MRISDWSSDVCSSDLQHGPHAFRRGGWPRAIALAVLGDMGGGRARCVGGAGRGPFDLSEQRTRQADAGAPDRQDRNRVGAERADRPDRGIDLQFHRSEEHTSALPSLMRTSYAVVWLKKKNN